MSDIDTRLREYAARWHAEKPVSVTVDSIRSVVVAQAQARYRGRVAVVSVLGIVCAVVLAAVVVVDHGHATIRVNAGRVNGGSDVAIASPPLLPHVMHPTDPIQLASGEIAGVGWKFYAQVKSQPPAKSQVSQESRAIDFGSGLCMTVSLQQASGGSCDDPRNMPRLWWQAFGPSSIFNAELIYGVTSAPASKVLVWFGRDQLPVTVGTVLSSKLPGLRFFVVDAPPGSTVKIEAVGKDGTPLLRSDPMLPPPPSASIGAAQGSFPVWPQDQTSERNGGSPEAIARNFSSSVLGLTTNAIVSDPTARPNSPTWVTIALGGGSLRVLAAPNLHGSWVLLQVGSAPDAAGINYSGGGPVITVHAPAGATQADITEKADDGQHYVHLTETQLSRGTAALAGRRIYSLLTVFRNSKGVIISAAGTSYSLGAG